jgi:hypothetical protein
MTHYFLSDISLDVNFARRKGSKDKKKRQISVLDGAKKGFKYGALGGAGLTGLGIAGTALTSPKARQIWRNNPRTALGLSVAGAGINALAYGGLGAGIGAGVNAIRKRDQNR